MISKIINSKSAKGFSILEVLIGISVSIIGVLAGYVLIISMKQTMSGSSAVVEAQQEARFILERMTRELRESNPDRVWTYSYEGGNDSYIVFYTPRKTDGEFMVADNGKPEWRRIIWYWHDDYSDNLLRYQIGVTEENGYPEYDYDTYQYEVVSENVEKLNFSQDKDMIIISLRTFGDKDKTSNMADSYTDLNTRVKLRN